MKKSSSKATTQDNPRIDVSKPPIILMNIDSCAAVSECVGALLAGTATEEQREAATDFMDKLNAIMMMERSKNVVLFSGFRH
jgi:hypothetical protein